MANPEWAYQQAYRATPAGRAAVERANAKYWASPKGREATRRSQAALRASPERLAARRAYETSAAYKAAAKARFATPEGKRSHLRAHLKRTFGLDVVKYDQMLGRQRGVCAICAGVNANGRRLHVDHDHATGTVRALLCGPCNLLLGTAKDDPIVLRKAIAYLRTHDEGMEKP